MHSPHIDLKFDINIRDDEMYMREPYKFYLQLNDFLVNPVKDQSDNHFLVSKSKWECFLLEVI